jgi:hypothetical protein
LYDTIGRRGKDMADAADDDAGEEDEVDGGEADGAAAGAALRRDALVPLIAME